MRELQVGEVGQFKRNLLSSTLQLRVTRALTHWGTLGWQNIPATQKYPTGWVKGMKSACGNSYWSSVKGHMSVRCSIKHQIRESSSAKMRCWPLEAGPTCTEQYGQKDLGGLPLGKGPPKKKNWHFLKLSPQNLCLQTYEPKTHLYPYLAAVKVSVQINFRK